MLPVSPSRYGCSIRARDSTLYFDKKITTTMTTTTTTNGDDVCTTSKQTYKRNGNHNIICKGMCAQHIRDTYAYINIKYIQIHISSLLLLLLLLPSVFIFCSVDTKPRLLAMALALAATAVAAAATLPNENSQPSSSLVRFDFGMCNNVSEACTHRTANVVVVAVIIIFIAVGAAVVFVDSQLKSAPHSFISKRFFLVAIHKHE